jgi:hypothetical protein
VGYCPGWRVEIRGLPPDVVASAVNDRGEVVREEAPGGPARVIQVSRQRAGEQWLLVFSDASGKPFERKLDVSFGLKPVR